MASSKKSSNGRSPLVNQQSQITAFFRKKPESSSSPSNSPSPTLSKQKPNPKEAMPTPSPSPITPSPLQSKRKPVLVISPNLGSSSTGKPSSDKKCHGAEVVDRRIKVYWPLDKCWYEGSVKSFDKISGKHLVQYDDAEEEMLNLSVEKIEWIEEPAKKKLRRLRRISLVEDEEDDLKELEDEGVDDLKELDDDSDDEDWGEKVGNEILEDDDGLEDLDLEVEEEKCGRTGVGKKMSSRKRNASEGEHTVPVATKKNKIDGELKNGVSKVSPSGSAKKLIEPTNGTSTYSKQ